MTSIHRFFTQDSLRLFKLLLAATLTLAGANVKAQCPVTELISGLEFPLGITRSDQGNLIVSESGTTTPNTGRITIVDVSGNRRTLLDGLPSGINDVGDRSGPAGLFLRGNTLYVAIGVGDVGRPGPLPGTTVPNPNPPSSALFSSVLAIHLSPHVENVTAGFTLSLADQQALAGGNTVKLSNGAGDKITVELIANFPDFTPNPLPFFADNIRLSNPFDLVAVGNQLYVTDGGQNLVRKVDVPTGSFSTLAVFPPIANPLFNPTPPPPSIGGPFLDAVPTGIAYSKGQLLVTLFRGFPFPPGVSVVEQVDPLTGNHTPFITGLKTAIDVLPIRDRNGEREFDDIEGEDDNQGKHNDYLVLQHTSVGPFFGSPGLLLRFETPNSAPTVIANCLNRPTSMAFDKKTGTLYVTELINGRIVAIPIE